MDLKITIFTSLLVLVKGGSTSPTPSVLAKIEDFDPAPQYTFAYDVQDAITGDSKAQFETRNGDVVQGSYSLIEADGTRRIVDYTADPVNGFNAVVNREPAVAVAPVVAPAVKVAAPVPVPAAKVIVPAARIVASAYAPAPVAVPVSPVVAKRVPVAPVLQKTLPLVAKSAAPAPIFLRAVVSSPVVDRQILSPISFTPAAVSGRIILAPSGFPRVSKVSNPISDNKIATLAAPLTYAAAGYAI